MYAVIIYELCHVISEQALRITDHADEEMAKDKLTYNDVKEAISKGVAIESYADDKPFPSCLVYGNHEEKHVHTVCAYSKEDKMMVLITVYIPDADKWINYKKRKKVEG